MDPFAHTLVGATLAETGLNRASRYATATLLIGANLPDIDAFLLLGGIDTALYHRRGWTHGVLAMALLPWLVVAAVSLWHRWRKTASEATFKPWRLLALAYLSVLSHPLLDWLNTYGVRLLMPFDGRWFYGDAIFIIDPWMWLLMACPVVLAHPRSSRGGGRWIALAAITTALVTTSSRTPWPAKVLWLVAIIAIAVARRRGARPAQRLARACFLLLSFYLGAMLTGSAIAHRQASAWLRASGIAATPVMTGPLPANPFVRDVVVAAADRYQFLRVDWLAEAGERIRESSPPIAIRDGPAAEVTAARQATKIRGFINWARFPTYRVEPLDGGGVRVLILDVRYARKPRDGFGAATVELRGTTTPPTTP